MASRTIGKLTARSVATLKEGMHGDGGGLWLRVQPGGRSWLFRFKSPRTGKQREMGLGTVADVTLAQARDAAASARKTLLEGKDPLEERRSAASAEKVDAAPTFRAAADSYIAAHRAGWRNPKHAMQWSASLDQHAYAVLGDRTVSAVDTAAVMQVLAPIWTTIPETATRIRGRIELVLDYAAAQGWRTGENPARWRGHVAMMLPRRSKVARVIHHAALPYKDIANVMAALATSRGTGALAVRFAAITAARSGEVRGATWSEINMVERVWTVPADRMKASREHRVPLSEVAMAVLVEAKLLVDLPGAGKFVFPGGRRGTSLSDVALSKALHLAAGSRDVTVHGLRSTFRDWCGESTAFAGDVAEAALAHSVRDKVEAAYRRGDLFEKRRQLMQAWAVFCTKPAPAVNVVPIRAAG